MLGVVRVMLRPAAVELRNSSKPPVTLGSLDVLTVAPVPTGDMLAASKLKVPPPMLVTVSDKVVVFVRPPPMAVMVTVAVPVVAAPSAVSVSAEVALPLAGGVTEPAENEAVTPAGRPEMLSDTAELKPLLLKTVSVLEPAAPCATDRLPGASDREKEAGGGGGGE